MEPQRQDKTKNASVKRDFSLIPWGALPHVAKVMEFGAQKYEALGFYAVKDRRRTYIKATMRHMVKFFIGVARGEAEPLDEETGLPHLHHAAASILIAIDDACDDLGVSRTDPVTARSAREPKTPEPSVPIHVDVWDAEDESA